MKTSIIKNLGFLFLINFLCYTASAQDSALAIPTSNPAQLAWQESEMGVVFHYDLHVFDGKRYAQNGQGDIVRDFLNSCHKYGIKPGIYMGIRWNSLFGVHDFKVNGEGEFQKNRQEYDNKMVEDMVTEICTRYGELFEIWFDGGASHPDLGAPDVLPIVKKYQPNCLFYHNNQLAECAGIF